MGATAGRTGGAGPKRSHVRHPTAIADRRPYLFGRQSGLQVSVHGDLLRGLSTPGVSGLMTSEQALTRLLAGTGLVFSLSGGTTVTLQKAGAGMAPGAIQLDPVQVQGYPVPQQALIDNIPPPYAGGQVATGGQVGLLGNRFGDGHAVQPDELHRQEGPGPAGEDSEGCPGRRSVGARLLSRWQHRQRRVAHPRLLGRRRQHRLQRPLRHPAVFPRSCRSSPSASRC